MMMSSENAVQQPCPYKRSANLNQADKQVVGQQATGQVSHRAEGHTPMSQAVGARQGATLGAKDYLITEVNKVDAGKQAIALYSLLQC